MLGRASTKALGSSHFCRRFLSLDETTSPLKQGGGVGVGHIFGVVAKCAQDKLAGLPC